MEIKRWKDIVINGTEYTECPYCNDKTEGDISEPLFTHSNYRNNAREYCPKCGKRVYAEGFYYMNQPRTKAHFGS